MNKSKSVNTIVSYLLITAGVVVVSLVLESILIPNLILDGGVTGVSIMLSKITGVSLGVFVVVINAPLLWIGYSHLGKKFLVKGVYAIVLFSVLLNLFHGVVTFTDDKLIATIIGGAILGLGDGLVVRSGGCLDGTEVIAILLSKKTQLSVGQVVLYFNIVIFSIAGFLFGTDRAMYSLITYFITFKAIDMVVEGLDQAKACMIITDESATIAENIYARLGRTVTILEGEGLVSGKKVILYAVLTRMELSELRDIVHEDDASAFVTIMDVSEVLGKHIKKTSPIVVDGLSIDVSETK